MHEARVLRCRRYGDARGRSCVAAAVPTSSTSSTAATCRRRPVALVARRQCRQVDRICGQLLPHPSRAGLVPVGYRRAPMRSPRRPRVSRPPNRRHALNGPKHWRPLDAARREAFGHQGMAISHTHPDQSATSSCSRRSMLRRSEGRVRMAGRDGAPRFNPKHPVTMLEGDRDVFGDGTVMIVSTPGHTPGHQSLLVKFPKTGAVVLSGDAVHFKANWDNRRVPAITPTRSRAAPRCSASPTSWRRKGPALDQPRQGAARRTEAVAGVLRLGGRARFWPVPARGCGLEQTAGAAYARCKARNRTQSLQRAEATSWGTSGMLDFTQQLVGGIASGASMG